MDLLVGQSDFHWYEVLPQQAEPNARADEGEDPPNDDNASFDADNEEAAAVVDAEQELEEDEPEEPLPPQWSTRAAKPTACYLEFKGQSHSQREMQQQCMDEYNCYEAKVIAMIMCQFNERMETSKIHHSNQYVVTYSLKEGIQKFGNPGKQAALKEMKQLHDRKWFEPIRKESLTATEKKRPLESLIFLTEKKGALSRQDIVQMGVHRENGWLERKFQVRQ